MPIRQARSQHNLQPKTSTQNQPSPTEIVCVVVEVFVLRRFLASTAPVLLPASAIISFKGITQGQETTHNVFSHAVDFAETFLCGISFSFSARGFLFISSYMSLAFLSNPTIIKLFAHAIQEKSLINRIDISS